MDYGYFKFNGIKSSDLGLLVQFIPTYKFAEKEFNTVTIPGRNGNLVVDKGIFRNVEKTYSIAKVFAPGVSFVDAVNSIVSWLHSADGYVKLEDSYEPEYYRLAMFKSDGELANFYDKATVMDVTFDCKPQRYLVSGDEEISWTSGESIQNPTSYNAHPTITFTPTAGSESTITIGDNTITIDALQVTEELTIDCENMECYSATKLYNSKVHLQKPEFPKLDKSTTTQISYTNLTNFKIKPRWWTI